MLARRIHIWACSIVIAMSFRAGAVIAQVPDAAPQPDVENSKYQATGRINRNDVFVRSGPGEGYFPTTKLNKGAAVTVVGIRFDWLKILPPEGSFSYVAKIYVERTGDGKTGRITAQDVQVHPGSSLNEMKIGVQTRLNTNDRVSIVGEKDEFFMVQPPAGAYLWVDKQFVDVESVRPATADANAPAGGSALPEQISGPAGQLPAVAPTSQGSEAQVSEVPASQPAAEPNAQDEAQNQFATLEQQFEAASAKPLIERPVAELLAGYEPLANGDKLPESLRRIAAARVATLKVQQQDQTTLTDLAKTQAAFAKQQQAAQAERQEIAQRIKETQVKFYAAVGELRPSSLQQGAGTLYRLTDPANGRTVVYVRTNDPNCGTMIGRFVGVAGQITTESQLPNARIVLPTTIEAVDPAHLADNVVAQIMPPSLAAQAPAAAGEPTVPTTNP